MNGISWLIATTRQAFKEYLCEHQWQRIEASGGKKLCLNCGAIQNAEKRRSF